jgi:Cu/Ag efflux protein CusF
LVSDTKAADKARKANQIAGTRYEIAGWLSSIGRRSAMRQKRIVILAAIVLALASAVYAQETLKGEVATVDEASGKSGIRLSGTVGSGDTTAPTTFKVQDGLLFNAVKPGDKVSIIVERTGDAMTIKQLTKE